MQFIINAFLLHLAFLSLVPSNRPSASPNNKNGMLMLAVAVTAAAHTIDISTTRRKTSLSVNQRFQSNSPSSYSPYSPYPTIDREITSSLSTQQSSPTTISSRTRTTTTNQQTPPITRTKKIKCPTNQSLIHLKLTTDAHPHETSWILLHHTTFQVIGHEDGSTLFSFTTYTYSFCAETKEACFAFVIHDSSGNGFLSNGGSTNNYDDTVISSRGSYKLFYQEEFLRYGSNFEYNETTIFGNACPSSTPSYSPSPSIPPSIVPSSSPTDFPSIQASIQPSIQASMQPSIQPSIQPSMQPSIQPSIQPTIQTSIEPSIRPYIEKCDEGVWFRLELWTDLYPKETFWTITPVEDVVDEMSSSLTYRDQVTMIKSSKDLIYESSSFYNHSLCMDPNECYIFTINDSYGDGLAADENGSYQVYYDGMLIQKGREFIFNQEVMFGHTCSSKSPSIRPIISPSQEPTISRSYLPSFTPTALECENGVWFRLELTTDEYPNETSWSITTAYENTIIESSKDLIYESSSFYNHSLCMDSNECYIFTINDSYGDGLAADENGSYQVYYDGILIQKGREFIFNQEVMFGHTCSSKSPSIRPIISPSQEPTTSKIPSYQPSAYITTYEDNMPFPLDLTFDEYANKTPWDLTSFQAAVIETSSVVSRFYYQPTTFYIQSFLWFGYGWIFHFKIL